MEQHQAAASSTAVPHTIWYHSRLTGPSTGNVVRTGFNPITIPKLHHLPRRAECPQRAAIPDLPINQRDSQRNEVRRHERMRGIHDRLYSFGKIFNNLIDTKPQ